MSVKLNVAQIGVGYWGPNLLRNLIGNKDCIVRTVVEISDERRNFVNKLYPSVKVTDQVDAVFNNTEIEAI